MTTRNLYETVEVLATDTGEWEPCYPSQSIDTVGWTGSPRTIAARAADDYAASMAELTAERGREPADYRGVVTRFTGRGEFGQPLFETVATSAVRTA